MSKGHTAARTQRVNMMGKMLGVAGDTRLRDCRQVSAAAWAPSSSAGESSSQSRSGATVSASCPAPRPSAGHSLPCPLLRICGCVLSTSNTQGLPKSQPRAGHAAPGVNEGRVCWCL